MYRQYENPRELEKQLQELEVMITSISPTTPNYEEVMQDLHDKKEDLEQRINFAWQDEEVG